MASYVGGGTLLVMKFAAVLLLLLGFLLIGVGLHNESSPAIAGGFLSLVGGVLLLVLKIVRRNQGSQL
jgi:hypothetical protein